MTRPARLLPALWSLVLGVVLLWPLHRGGYPLGRDMVFTPHPSLTWSALGLGSAPPRAVPVDTLVALLTHVLGGTLLSRLALLVPLVLAGAGAAALTGAAAPDARRWPGVVAATLAVWNPYVVERLAMGNWSLLWGYAALPWLVRALRRWRDEDGGVAPVLLWVAAASITPTGGVLAVVTVAVWAVGRRATVLAAGTLALQLCWVVPGVVGTAQATSDPSGVAAFAARAEHPGGTLLSLLGGGGAWNAGAAPDSRAHWPAWLGLVLTAAALVLGWRPVADVLGRATRARLAGLAVAGVLVAVAASTPGADAVVRLLVRDVPGGGLLRDAQKWVAPYVVAVAVFGGCAVLRVTAAALTRTGVGLAATALPLLALPDAARTVRPVLDPVRYPADWTWAARAVDGTGAVAVLPFQPYRAFAWAPGRPVLDPAPRLVPADVVASDRLTVDGRTLTGEDDRARRVGAALTGSVQPQALARLGVRWVLVERGTPGALPDLAALQPVRRGSSLVLYRVPGPVAAVRPAAGRVALVLAGDAVAVLVLVGAAGAAAAAGRRRPRLLGSSPRAGTEET